MIINNGFEKLGWLFFPLLLTGCAPTKYSDSGVTMNAVPEATFSIPAKITYDGNPDYLPRSLANDQGDAAVTAVYVYQVIYDSEKEHPLTVFNPLLIAGVSKSEDAVIILARLEMFRGTEALKKYEKAVTLSKNKTIFSEGETLTQMRRNGLLHVRDDIDQQVYADRDFWQRALGE